MSQNLPKARTYIRINSKKSSSNLPGPEAQIKLITNFCIAKRIELIEIYEDNNLSGITMERPGLQKLLKDFGPNECIVIADLSRISRVIKDALYLINLIQEKGAYFICLDPEIDLSNQFNRSLSLTMTSLLKLEREKKPKIIQESEEVIKKSRSRSKAPFGYQYIGPNIELEIIPEQQTIIQKIKDLHAQKKKLTHIADQLNKDGDNKTLSLNKKNGIDKIYRFHPGTVKRILIDQGLVEANESNANRTPLERRIKLKLVITHDAK